MVTPEEYTLVPVPNAVAAGHKAMRVYSLPPKGAVTTVGAPLMKLTAVALEVYTVADMAKGMIPAISVEFENGGTTFLRPGCRHAST